MVVGGGLSRGCLFRIGGGILWGDGRGFGRGLCGWRWRLCRRLVVRMVLEAVEAMEAVEAVGVV